MRCARRGLREAALGWQSTCAVSGRSGRAERALDHVLVHVLQFFVERVARTAPAGVAVDDAECGGRGLKHGALERVVVLADHHKLHSHLSHAPQQYTLCLPLHLGLLDGSVP